MIPVSRAVSWINLYQIGVALNSTLTIMNRILGLQFYLVSSSSAAPLARGFNPATARP